MNLPRWADMPDNDRAASVLFLFVRAFSAGGAYRHSPAVYRTHPALTQLSPTLACNHAVTLHPQVRALPAREHQRLLDLALSAIPSQEGTRNARAAA